MRNLKLTIRYDGTEFFGWQTQPGRRTVQEVLERAVAEITREDRVRVNASGRTDSGVHAVAQVANVYTASKLGCETLLKAVNAKLPADGFVYNMVRAIAGSLVQVGRGYWPESRIEEVLAAKDRRLAGPTAPPEGLFLMRVTYRECGVRSSECGVEDPTNHPV